MSEQFSGRVTVVDGSQREVFAFDSTFAVLDLGAQGNEGDLRVRGDDGAPKIHLDGGRQLVTVTNAAGVTVLRFDASHSLLDLGPSLGGAGAEADLRPRSTSTARPGTSGSSARTARSSSSSRIPTGCSRVPC